MNPRWWAFRLVGAILIGVGFAIVVILLDNRPDTATCAQLPVGTTGCAPIDWSPVWWLLGVGAVLFVLPVFFEKKS